MSPLDRSMQAISNFFFPTLCLHCHARSTHFPFCEGCQEALCPLPPHGEFSSSIFPRDGIGATLCQTLKSPFSGGIAKGVAGYFAHHFLQLEWPKPLFLVPIPTTHCLHRDPIIPIVQHLSHLLEIPKRTLLKKTLFQTLKPKRKCPFFSKPLLFVGLKKTNQIEVPFNLSAKPYQLYLI